jgi:AAA+ ATPase superfamily predicted ATPase
MLLIDRASERADLARLLRPPGPYLGILYGRRRVGKTYLLTHGWPEGTTTFYYAAAQATPELNRRDLVDTIGRWSQRTFDPDQFRTWRSVFELLFELETPGPLAVVLDEYQYLNGGDDDADSQLAAVWEVYKTRRPMARPFALVLCGSMVRVMERLDAGGNPLHGRITWKRQLEAFDYWNAAAMARFPAMRDRAYAYGIYGGTPHYLATITPGETLAENVARDVLSPGGAVRSQVETVIEQEVGLRDISAYKSILTAIGSGCTERNEIAQRTGLANDAALHGKLDRLMELGYIGSSRNFEARPKEAIRYRLLDPALRFYYHTVARYRSELHTRRASTVWKLIAREQLDQYMGLVFEQMVWQAYVRLSDTLSLPMVREWGCWEGVDAQRAPLEIDIVARLTSGGMLTGAIKWTHTPVGIKIHTDHLIALRRLADAGHAWAHKALDPGSPMLYAAAGGFQPGFVKRAEEDGRRVVAWTLRQMYAR